MLTENKSMIEELEQEETVKIPNSCPWCGKSKNRPRKPNIDGTCDDRCVEDFKHYRAHYDSGEYSRRGRN